MERGRSDKTIVWIFRLVVTCIMLLGWYVVQARSEECRLSPVENAKLTSPRGWRKDPFGSGKMFFHHGWDLAAPVGTPVWATRTGVVSFSGWYKGYGWLVVIDHLDGWYTMYGHNSALHVAAGEQVDCSKMIAQVGSTGRSTGPHVHFEFRYQAKSLKGGILPQPEEVADDLIANADPYKDMGRK